MGKRELLLLVVFVVLGVGVYQVAAPAAPAHGQGFSLSRLVQMAKAHFHGANVRRPVTRTATLAVGDEVTTFDLGEPRGGVFVEGADRPDIEVRLEAVLGGIDEADLAQQEKAFGLTLTADGDTAKAVVTFDKDGRAPRYELHVQMPHRLAARLSGRGSAEVRGVAGLRLIEYRGELKVDELTGPVTGDLDDARAEFGAGITLDLETRNGRLRADAPASVTLQSERGTVEIVDPAGPISIKTDYCRMDIRGTGGPVTITGEGGVIDLRDVSHPLTIDAERLTVTAELGAPVPTSITVADDTVEVTLPREGGVQLDAAIKDGALRLPHGLTSTRADGRESVSAKIGGGGPLVKVEVNAGELRIRSRAPQPGT